jgi:hypothetical protein
VKLLAGSAGFATIRGVIETRLEIGEKSLSESNGTGPRCGAVASVIAVRPMV